jgi:alpha-N-acetylglucosaminidase
MALNSINTPLAFVGQEHIFKSLYTSPAVGLSDADVEHFFAGPSLLPWNRMGNIKQWLGPLPQGWMESHRVLQQKILQRMRELGMRPILPGFSGLVPDAMKNKYPEASFKQAHWGAFRPTTFIGELTYMSVIPA